MLYELACIEEPQFTSVDVIKKNIMQTDAV